MSLQAEIAAKQLGDRLQRVLLDMKLAADGVQFFEEARKSLNIKRVTKDNLGILHGRDMIRYYPNTHLTAFGKEVADVIQQQRSK